MAEHLRHNCKPDLFLFLDHSKDRENQCVLTTENTTEDASALQSNWLETPLR